MISIDTTRADRLSSYGFAGATTPTIDALASGGVRFANVYSPMPTTDPSHTTMLTGLYPRSHGIMRNAAKTTDPERESLGSWLQDHGYTTAAITARLGLDPKMRGIRGFDHTDSPRLPTKWRPAAEIVGRTRNWLNAHDGSPWFLWAHIWEPHKPYEPEEPFRSRFVRGVEPGTTAVEDPPRFLSERQRIAPSIVERSRKLYAAEVATADKAVAFLLDAARKAEPVGGELLVILVSDHGESLAERQRSHRIGFGHGALIYDEVVKVPWVMAWDGAIGAHVVNTPVSLVDLAPTVVGLIDADDPLDCEGRSLAKVAREGGEPESVPILLERRIFGSHPQSRLEHLEAALIDYPWKLILNEGGQAPELYRLDSDPEELRDLAAGESVRADEMTSRLEKWKSARPLPSRIPKMTREREQELEALRALGYID